MAFLLFIALSSFHQSEQHCYLENLSSKNRYEVWVSEDSMVIFSGIVYPLRKVMLPMIPNKLYGIKIIQLDHFGEVVVAPKIYQAAPHTTKDGIDYYRCKSNTSLVYRFGSSSIP